MISVENVREHRQHSLFLPNSSSDLLHSLKGKASLQRFTGSPASARDPLILKIGILPMGLGLTLILTERVRYLS